MKKKLKPKKNSAKKISKAKASKSLDEMSDDEYIKKILDTYIQAPLVAYACWDGDSCGMSCTTAGPGTTYACC